MSKPALRESILSTKPKTTLVKNVFNGHDLSVCGLTLQRRTLLLDAMYANERANAAWKADQEKPEAQRAGLPRVDLHQQAVLMILFCVVDDAGDLVFTIDDHDAFTALDYADLNHLYEEITKLHTRDPQTEKKSSE